MQNPRSILLHLDGALSAAHRIAVALRVAERFDAKVTAGYCVTPALQRYPMALEGAGLAAGMLADLDDDARDKAKAVYAKACGGSPRIAWAEGLAPWAFAQRALYADLAILAQRDPEDPAAGEVPTEFVQGVIVDSGRPALVLPYAQARTAVAPGTTVLVAWKETRESARAVAAALPWLAGAKAVHLIAYGEDTGPPLHALSHYLAGHGIASAVHPGGPEEGGAGTQLLSRAADLGADLLVMGCFGHSRAREWVLGGATRAVLQSMTLPVLMVH
jgi:nucleotide-binding universal stress UspA family protein